MISVKHRGSFKNLDQFFDFYRNGRFYYKLHKYGKMGVEALASATPVDTGKTASSWSYQIEFGTHGLGTDKIMFKEGVFSLVWTNSNVNQDIPIAILIQYGHGTGRGAYVQGTDFINPAIRPVFDFIAEDIWREVTSA